MSLVHATCRSLDKANSLGVGLSLCTSTLDEHPTKLQVTSHYFTFNQGYGTIPLRSSGGPTV